MSRPSSRARTGPTSTPAISPVSIASLPQSVLACALAPLLTTADQLALSSVDKVTRRLVVTPPPWQDTVFTFFPPPATCTSSLPSLRDVVQLMQTLDGSFKLDGDGHMPAEWPLSFSTLLRLPSLCHLHVRGKLFGCWGERRPEPSPFITSLASLHHLTRITLFMSTYPPNSLDAIELRLLSTLPALASFTAQDVIFGDGNEETLAEFLVVSGEKQSSKKRKASEQNEKEGKQVVEAEEAETTERSSPSEQRKRNDLNLLKRWTPLLLFLHALAAKPASSTSLYLSAASSRLSWITCRCGRTS